MDDAAREATGSKDSHTFHITIGASPRGSGQTVLEKDLRLIKTALLYGDAVRLCSLTASFLTQLVAFGGLDEDERRRQVLHMFSEMDPVAGELVRRVAELRKKRRRTRQELLQVMQLESVIRESSQKLTEVIQAMFAAAGGESLMEALETGILEIEQYDASDFHQAFQAFLQSVGESLISGRTYPLLDDETGILVRAAMSEGLLDDAPSGAGMGRVIGLASDVLERLPTFEEASVLDVLRVRSELPEPLIRFRGALSDFAETIQSAQWDRDFRGEAELVFRKRVAPAAAALEEAIRENTFGQHLLRSLSSPLQASGVGVLVGKLADFADLTGLAAGLTGAGSAAGAMGVSAYRDWRENTKELERNQLYFYVAASKRLDGAS